MPDPSQPGGAEPEDCGAYDEDREQFDHVIGTHHLPSCREYECSGCADKPGGAESVEGPPSDERFCSQCGIIHGCDEDGCCASCGAVTCEMADMKSLLRAQGLHIVGEEEMRVLEACKDIVIDETMLLDEDGERRDLDEDCAMYLDCQEAVIVAELARRAAKKEM